MAYFFQMSAAGPQAPGRNVQGLPPFGTGSSPGHSSGGAGDGMSRGGVGASGNPQQRRKFVDPDGKFRKVLIYSVPCSWSGEAIRGWLTEIGELCKLYKELVKPCTHAHVQWTCPGSPFLCLCTFSCGSTWCLCWFLKFLSCRTMSRRPW